MYADYFNKKVEVYNRLKDDINNAQTRLENGDDQALNIEYLLRHDIRELTNFFEFAKTDMIEAAKEGDLEVVKFLFDRVDKDTQYRALNWAVNKNNLDIIKFLLRKRLNPFLKVHDKTSAYQIAKMFSYADITILFEEWR